MEAFVQNRYHFFIFKKMEAICHFVWAMVPPFQCSDDVCLGFRRQSSMFCHLQR